MSCEILSYSDVMCDVKVSRKQSGTLEIFHIYSSINSSQYKKIC